MSDLLEAVRNEPRKELDRNFGKSCALCPSTIVVTIAAFFPPGELPPWFYMLCTMCFSDPEHVQQAEAKYYNRKKFN